MPDPLHYSILQDADDGVEQDGTLWMEDGLVSESDTLSVGFLFGSALCSGLRFETPELSQGESVVYARLRLPAQGEAFDALTPGKQREYAKYVAEAKREETRLSRTKKIMPMIKAGKGLNDRYRC